MNLAAAANPPPSGAYPFIFTDDAGVVVTSPTQPFYGIGMLKMADAGRWMDALNALLDRYIASVSVAGVKKSRTSYEFHFSGLTTTTRPFYERLIDFFASQPDGYFCALVIDKNMPGVDPIKACGTPWDALIKYSITLLKRNIGTNERAIVISDNYQKPRKSPYYYERSLAYRLGSKVTNVVMIESAACLMLQLVDVLLGCVMYHFKMPRLSAVDADKKAVADRLAAAYGVPTLGTNLTILKPNYFSVWKLKPNTHFVKAATAAPAGEP